MLSSLCQAFSIARLTSSPYTTKIARIRHYTMLSTFSECRGAIKTDPNPSITPAVIWGSVPSRTGPTGLFTAQYPERCVHAGGALDSWPRAEWLQSGHLERLFPSCEPFPFFFFADIKREKVLGLARASRTEERALGGSVIQSTSCVGRPLP